MTTLQRIDYRPSYENLSPDEEANLRKHFTAYGAEMVIDGIVIRWEYIDEVEVAFAPRGNGLAGWLVKKFVLQDEQRYHVGVYFASLEAILPNISLNMVKHVLENIAFYSPKPIRYVGPENIVRLSEI
ncbi:MAG: hypothetical protein SH821_04610 [Phototrophicales bacterium]|nr:hypothetical protein [Phototrophicales bacterium]